MSHRQRWEDQLKRGLAEMGLEMEEFRQHLLLEYLTLLYKWNKTYNLTAIRDPEQMVSRQLLDSLSVLHLVQGTRVLDVGSGPGLPGIPLAVALPESRFTLLDANGKKTRFMQQVKTELALKSLEVVRSRVEDFHPTKRFDTVTTRAFASLSQISRLTGHLVETGGRLLAMKGIEPKEEIEALSAEGVEVKVIPLRVSQLKGLRHAILWRTAVVPWSDP
ncbi:MAG: 16S rRNA (guanine(527)-N(7))-methyltransferase RsmG [Gammaproteobacteria bacterium]|nr:16S rRNA (guanine(527)-N(7))-methyltransferase RsmG [Gammaproteobacteria bacterium]